MTKKKLIAIFLAAAFLQMGNLAEAAKAGAVPDWAKDALDSLPDGEVSKERLEFATELIEKLDRIEDNMGMDALSDKEKDTVQRLKREFAQELKILGYADKGLLNNPTENMNAILKESTNSDESDIADDKVHVRGELRYSFADNGDEGKFDYTDSRLRLRLFADAPLSPVWKGFDNTWRAYTMLEEDKSLIGDGGSDDIWDGSRFYIEGMSGLTKLTVGKFGYMMADGNIYDSSYTGIRAAATKGDMEYTAAKGHSASFDENVAATVKYNAYDYDVEGGAYYFRENGGDKNAIYTLGGTYYLDKYYVGAMYLHASPENSKGEDGFVYKIGFGNLKSWEAGSQEIVFRYYDQPRYTYEQHTMTGLGNRMNGFKGFGASYYYTLRENLVAGVEYYALKDYISDEDGNTIWAQITYYF